MLSSARPRTLLGLVNSDLSLRCLSRRERVALGALCLCVLVLLAALSTWPSILRRRDRYADMSEKKPNLHLDPFRNVAVDELFHFGRERCRLAVRSGGLAANPIADGRGRRNHSADCFARSEARRFDAYCADCRQLSCFQSVPDGVGSVDSGLFALRGVESIGNQ